MNKKTYEMPTCEVDGGKKPEYCWASGVKGFKRIECLDNGKRVVEVKATENFHDYLEEQDDVTLL